jgi:hypothetical protein
MKATPIIAPFGSRKPPITADCVAAGAVGLAQLRLVDDLVGWVECRPAKRARCALMERRPDGALRELTPPP